jgi:hypothetical protein
MFGELNTGGAALQDISEFASKRQQNPRVGIREANMLIWVRY